MARPKVPIALQQGRLPNEIKQQRQEQEDHLKCENTQLKAPKWLDKEAQKEFRRIVKILIEKEIAGNLDLAILSIYCDAYSNYIKLTQAIQESGPVEEYTNTMGATNKIVSANVQAQSKYAETIMKCAGRMGLSASDRLKLVVPKNDDEKDELLKALRD